MVSITVQRSKDKGQRKRIGQFNRSSFYYLKQYHPVEHTASADGSPKTTSLILAQ